VGLFDGTPLERPVLCERCGKDVKECDCPPVEEQQVEPETPPEKQRLKLRTEKRKRGKVVTVVAGLSGSSQQKQLLLSELKDLCGAGGTIDDWNIEIQGKHVERISEYLRKKGYGLAGKK
jgi:translation initiation factor 1